MYFVPFFPTNWSLHKLDACSKFIMLLLPFPYMNTRTDNSHALRIISICFWALAEKIVITEHMITMQVKQVECVSLLVVVSLHFQVRGSLLEKPPEDPEI